MANKKEFVQTYSFLIGLEKTLFRVIIAGPIVATVLPEAWMNLTLGAAITFFFNWAKNYKFDEENQS